VQFEIKIVITVKGYMKIRREANEYVKIYCKWSLFQRSSVRWCLKKVPPLAAW